MNSGRLARSAGFCLLGGLHAVVTTMAAGPAGSGQQDMGPAFACDHRWGAEATFTQNTDTARTQSFFYAEACAFKYNLQATVYDSPFGGDLGDAQRRAAHETGRLGFEIYLQTDRWHDPGSEEDLFPLIPDYYANEFSGAAADAGFEVRAGEKKTSRRPNHGKQLYDISGGLYGYDTAAGRPGRTDVLGGLIRHQADWVRDIAGYYPAAAAFRNGQQGARYAIPAYLLGARNSSQNGDIRYGASTEGFAYCGLPGPFGPQQTRSYPSTTRAGDMDAPAEEVLAHCMQLLQQAIEYRGWYRDFIHWHTNPRFELTLHDFYQAVRRRIGTNRVAALTSGEALQHRYLREMAEVNLVAERDRLLLDVTYENAHDLPLDCFRIPLSVKLKLDRTALAGNELTSPDAVSIRKLGADLFVVDVPFNRRTETVRVHILPAAEPRYADETPPRITNVNISGRTLAVRADRPVRLAVFSWPASLDLGDLQPTDRAHRVDVVSRSNELKTEHRVELDRRPDDMDGRSLHIGAITAERQSILAGPYPP